VKERKTKMTNSITAVPTTSPWWVRKWDVASASERGKVYRVAQDKGGGFGCDCPRWKFRREECRHIQLVKAKGLTLPAPSGAPLPPPACQPVGPVVLRELKPGAPVWAVVQGQQGKAMRLKGEAVNVSPELVKFKSNRTGTVYEVPSYLVFHQRPEAAVVETAY
jgi:hypothetical protein